MLTRKHKVKQTADVAKFVAAATATAVGLTAGALLKQRAGKNSINSIQSHTEEIRETATKQAEEIKDRMQKETEEKIRDVQSGVSEAAVAQDEIKEVYKKAKHEMKKIAKEAQKQLKAIR
ncbi:MAG: hypothetical protein SCK29_12840 [Bacillota bacterium]|nr:hypothetical protein [Bacillota bacterium]